jgi:hypothetical protein
MRPGRVRPDRWGRVPLDVLGLAGPLCFAAILLATGCATVPTEKPSYQVTQRFDDFELRDYASYVVAETDVSGTRESAGNDGFRVLAGYIFGKNKGSRKLAMTAPVAQSEGTKLAMTAPVALSAGAEGGTWTIQFMMPSQYALADLPEPLDPRVRFRVVPPRRVAARTYSGGWSSSRYEEELARFRAALSRAQLTAAGEPVWARFDPPFKPWFLRTNEIWIELAR